MTKQEEIDIKNDLIERFDQNFIDDLCRIAIEYEVEKSYFETTWNKGLALLYFLDRGGVL